MEKANVIVTTTPTSTASTFSRKNLHAGALLLLATQLLALAPTQVEGLSITLLLRGMGSDTFNHSISPVNTLSGGQWITLTAENWDQDKHIIEGTSVKFLANPKYGCGRDHPYYGKITSIREKSTTNMLYEISPDSTSDFTDSRSGFTLKDVPRSKIIGYYKGPAHSNGVVTGRPTAVSLPIAKQMDSKPASAPTDTETKHTTSKSPAPPQPAASPQPAAVTALPKATSQPKPHQYVQASEYYSHYGGR